MATFETAFRKLGLPDDASDEDVHNARANLALKYGDLGRIPKELQEAYDLLVQHRAAYAAILECCESGTPLKPGADKIEILTNLAKQTDIRYAQDLEVPGIFHLWRPDQPEPAVVAQQRARHEMARQESRSRWPHARRWLARTLPVLGLCAAAVTAYYGFRYFQATAQERADQAAIAARNELRAQLVADLDLADREFTELSTAGRQLGDEFSALAGQPIEKMEDAGGRSRELNLTILRHASVREAWDAIQRDRLTDAQRAAFGRQIDGLRARLRGDAFSVDDRVHLRELRQQIADRLASVRRAQQDVVHVSEMLSGDRFEASLPATTRESP